MKMKETKAPRVLEREMMSPDLWRTKADSQTAKKAALKDIKVFPNPNFLVPSYLLTLLLEEKDSFLGSVRKGSFLDKSVESSRSRRASKSGTSKLMEHGLDANRLRDELFKERKKNLELQR